MRIKKKLYSKVHISENLFCLLLENSNLPPVIIDSKWEGLSKFITSNLAAGKCSRIHR